MQFFFQSLLFLNYTPVVKILKECYIGFLPKESGVFTFNYPESFKLFSPGMRDKREMMTRIADQLATLSATIGEFPAIRCHRCCSKNSCTHCPSKGFQKHLNNNMMICVFTHYVWASIRVLHPLNACAIFFLHVATHHYYGSHMSLCGWHACYIHWKGLKRFLDSVLGQQLLFMVCHKTHTWQTWR